MSESKGLRIAGAMEGAAGTLQAAQLKRASEISLKPKGHTDAEIQKAATQFEALLLHQMIGEMWKSVPNEGLLSGSREETMYRDMLNQALADNISSGQGIGIKNVVMKELKRTEEKQKKSD